MSFNSMANGLGQRGEELPAELGRLFAAYRDSFPDADPHPNFMPRVWEAIEARNKLAYRFGRLTRAFVSAAAAVCLLLAAITMTDASGTSPVYTTTYLEVLADDGAYESEAEAL